MSGGDLGSKKISTRLGFLYLRLCGHWIIECIDKMTWLLDEWREIEGVGRYPDRAKVGVFEASVLMILLDSFEIFERASGNHLSGCLSVNEALP